ncbi:hypothetical protein CVT26_009157 [Gymnopilus dilepis]|uniref:Uncharacterized protein n=1 Tax=Gymnopilus dilepis TaxID=231916 RepID=A0A409Y9Q2_9AGAR|nr:hypothetical protein CVT26_009157 [Gymnopilus dilepis]
MNMSLPVRYIIIVLFLIISIHYIVSFTHEPYGRATSLASLKSKILPSKFPYSSSSDSYDNFPPHAPTKEDLAELAQGRRANATFVILARNTDLSGTIRSIREIEDRFNRRYMYPYVLLNEVPFTEEFKR